MSSPGSSPSSPALTSPTTMIPLSSSPPRGADTGSSSDLTPRSSPRTPSPLNPHHHSQSLSPHSRASLIPSPTATRGRLRSSGARDPSPVRGATQPAIPMTRVASAPAAPQSTVGVSIPLPVVSPANSAPAVFPFNLRPHSRSPASSPERGGGHESDDVVSSWWDQHIHSPRPWGELSKRKRSIPAEQAEGYIHTRTVRFLTIALLVFNLL